MTYPDIKAYPTLKKTAILLKHSAITHKSVSRVIGTRRATQQPQHLPSHHYLHPIWILRCPHPLLSPSLTFMSLFLHIPQKHQN